VVSRDDGFVVRREGGADLVGLSSAFVESVAGKDEFEDEDANVGGGSTNGVGVGIGLPESL